MRLFALMGALLVLLASGCTRQDARDAGREAQEVASEAADTAADSAERAGERAVDAVDDLSVAAQDNAFVPAQTSASIGQEVTWVNRDNVPHAVEADNASFKSDTLGPGKEFSFRFTQGGEYPYHCTIHGTAMSGVVRVA